MGDDLKILKVEYLSKDRFDLPPILNIRLGDQTEIGNRSNKILKWNISDRILIKFEIKLR